MIAIKIAAFICIAIDLILIVAYIEVHRTMQWYKRQFLGQPRTMYRLIPKISWQQRLVNIILLRKPVSIKRPFKTFKVDSNEELNIRTGT
jgi:hypothetical protein